MTKDEDFKLLKIQTFILKVNIHCYGCKQEVKKLLQKIEGVYTVNIDADHHKVTVSGNVDPKTLIKKLVRSGKPVELWSQKSKNQISHPNQQQQQQQQLQHQHLHQQEKHNGNKISKGQPSQDAFLQGLKAFKDQQSNKLDVPLSSSDGEEYDDEDDEDYDDDDEEDISLGILEKMKQLNLPKQGSNAATPAPTAGGANTKKNSNAGGTVNTNGNGVGKKAVGANPNQVMGLDPKGFAGMTNTKMAGTPAHFVGGSGANLIPGDSRKIASDMNKLMGLQGLGGNNNTGAGLSLHNQGQQHQHQLGTNNLSTGFPANPNAGVTYQNHPSMMNFRENLNNNLMVNEGSRYMVQQPQVMYNKSPQTLPYYTGYYYPYPSYPSHPYYQTGYVNDSYTGGGGGGIGGYGVDNLVNDHESSRSSSSTSSSCVVM